MHTKDAVVNHDTQRQKVKHVGKVRPDRRRAVLSLALRVEAVRLPVCTMKTNARASSATGNKNRYQVRQRSVCVMSRRFGGLWRLPLFASSPTPSPSPLVPS